MAEGQATAVTLQFSVGLASIGGRQFWPRCRAMVCTAGDASKRDCVCKMQTVALGPVQFKVSQYGHTLGE